VVSVFGEWKVHREGLVRHGKQQGAALEPVYDSASTGVAKAKFAKKAALKLNQQAFFANFNAGSPESRRL
jgi:hypothetical protein